VVGEQRGDGPGGAEDQDDEQDQDVVRGRGRSRSRPIRTHGNRIRRHCWSGKSTQIICFSRPPPSPSLSFVI
jgi:hypothetical protein